MKLALVTGSAGFVGRHMTKALAERGYSVWGIDIANPSGIDCRRWFDQYWGESFALVVHCAAVAGGRTTIDGAPLLLAVEDLSIDAALFRWALKARPGRIVAFSSSAAYPVDEQRKCPCGMTGWSVDDGWEWAEHRRERAPWDGLVPCGWCNHGGVDHPPYALAEALIDPANPAQPDQTYGWVKLTLERLAAEANAEGIRTHVFRPFSGYGADQALDYPFPTFVRRAVERQSPFQIWGDGGSARDWIHIDDVVGAVLAAIDGDVLGPVNLCTGRATTFDDLAEQCMSFADHWAPIEYVGDAPQGVFWRVGDPTLMQEFYRPKVTLEEGIARAMRQAVAA